METGRLGFGEVGKASVGLRGKFQIELERQMSMDFRRWNGRIMLSSEDTVEVGPGNDFFTKFTVKKSLAPSRKDDQPTGVCGGRSAGPSRDGVQDRGKRASSRDRWRDRLHDR